MEATAGTKQDQGGAGWAGVVHAEDAARPKDSLRGQIPVVEAQRKTRIN